MLIVHILTRFLRAGCEENTLATCRAQLRAGHKVYVIYGEEGDDAFIQAQPADLEFIRIPSFIHAIRPHKDAKALLDLTRALRDLKPDVVHTHQSKAGILGRASAKLAGVPTIIHGVHILPFLNVSPVQKFIYVAAERVVAQFTDAFISVSKGMMDACIANKIGKPQSHYLVYSGMDIARFENAEPPANWRALLKLDANAPKPPILLFLAALETRKRQDAFLRAAPHILKHVPNMRILFAGDGPNREALAALTQQLNLTDAVEFLGFYPAPEQLIALADMTVLTSYREGLPRVVVQSLAGGTPAALTHLEGIEEVLSDGENGLITATDDLDGLAEKIAKAFSDANALSQLTQGAERSDMSPWDQRLMTERIDEIYAITRAGQGIPQQDNRAAPLSQEQ